MRRNVQRVSTMYFQSANIAFAANSSRKEVVQAILRVSLLIWVAIGLLK
jgi:hypothetical protein